MAADRFVAAPPAASASKNRSSTAACRQPPRGRSLASTRAPIAAAATRAPLASAIEPTALAQERATANFAPSPPVMLAEESTSK